MPVIPPWIQPADPAAHMARGMQIGIQIGAQQAQQIHQQQQAAMAQQEMDAQAAAQRFKEVQAARQEQIAARDQALAESKYQLAASQAASKHQAMQEYQSAIAGGMDPNEAMLKWGPAMSANTGAAAAIRAQERMSRAPKTWSEVTLPSGLSTLQSSTGDIRFPPKPSSGAVAKVPEGASYVPATADTPAHWALPTKPKGELTENQMLVARSRIEREMETLGNAVTYDISPESTEPTLSSGKPASKKTIADWKRNKARYADLIKQREDIENRILGAGGTSTSTGTAQAEKKARVRVISPDGKTTGSIPAEQVDEALAHGYSLAK